ncbi:MAG: hypothetical protein WCG04_00445 [Alphaproteobacteria bacterium]
MKRPSKNEPVAPSPQAIQLELLAPWFGAASDESRTLDLFDAIPKYPFPTTRVVSEPTRITASFTVGKESYSVEIVNAQIKDKSTQKEILVFPGAREELVERALRFIAIQQSARTHLAEDEKTGQPSITVFFTVSQVRRHLEDLGHGYKVAEIKEALDILSGTEIIVSSTTHEGEKGVRKRHLKAPILSNYIGDMLDGDVTGDDSKVGMTFHPWATRAIVDLAYYPINQFRVGTLKKPLSRWLTSRLSHNFRQASKFGFIQKRGYHIALETMLLERALTKEPRMRDTVQTVRVALKEMAGRGILEKGMPFEEALVFAPTGQKKIIGAVWTLYPSNALVSEVIEGNKTMRALKEEKAKGEEDRGRRELFPS